MFQVKSTRRTNPLLKSHSLGELRVKLSRLTKTLTSELASNGGTPKSLATAREYSSALRVLGLKCDSSIEGEALSGNLESYSCFFCIITMLSIELR